MAEHIPVIDRDALGMADLAFIQSTAPTVAGRMKSAVFAYLYALENRTEDGGFVIYPSPAAIAAAEARHVQS